MVMNEENVKERLIQATMDLLKKEKSAKKMTARKIAETADANLAMINYYFKSKDELVSLAVNQLIEASGEKQEELDLKDQVPKERLITFLTAIADSTCEYAELTRPTIPYLLLEGEFDLSYQILPLIKECFNNQRDETECRVIAYQLVSFLQIAFYRGKDFERYSSIDVMDEHQRHQLCRVLVEDAVKE